MILSEFTGKQKAFLRGLGMALKPTVLIGKNGVTDNTFLSVNNGFNTKELLKIKIQDGCELEKEEVAALVGKKTKSKLVQIIGNMILLYKRHDEPKIHLP